MHLRAGQYDGDMSLGFSDTSFLFFLALLLFGPKKLPEIGRQIGKFMNEFKRASNEFRSQIESEIASLERQSDPTPQILPPTRAPEGAIASGMLVDAPDPAPAHVPEFNAPAPTNEMGEAVSEPPKSPSETASVSSEASISESATSENPGSESRAFETSVSETPASVGGNGSDPAIKAPHV
jgi:sec-independent protein translocase protein TatB